MYLTIGEALQKLGFRYNQLMEVNKAGHIQPYLNRDGQSQPIPDAVDIAELATLDLERHCDSQAQQVYLSERLMHFAEDIQDWKFLDSQCDRAIIGVKSAPKKTAFARRAPIVVQAIENLGMTPMLVTDKNAVLRECQRLDQKEFNTKDKREETWSEGSRRKLWRHINADKASSKKK